MGFVVVRLGGLSVICCPEKDSVVLLVLNELRGIFLGAVILGGLKGFQSISERTGEDVIPGGYITKFHFFEVRSSNGIMQLDGVAI